MGVISNTIQEFFLLVKSNIGDKEDLPSVILSASIGLIVGGMLSLIISFMQREKPSKPTKKKSA
jgi:hypothetical protein